MGLDPDGCGDMQGDDGSKKIGERSMNIRIKSYAFGIPTSCVSHPAFVFTSKISQS